MKAKKKERKRIKKELMKYLVAGPLTYTIFISPEDWHKIFKTK